MTFDELNEGQRTELKQHILTERNEHRGEGTSYEELALADDLVSDEDLENWYGSTEFSPDDFTGPCRKRTVTVERIPQWAVCYLVNSDDDSLSSDDKKQVDEYVKRLFKGGAPASRLPNRRDRERVLHAPGVRACVRDRRLRCGGSIQGRVGLEGRGPQV